MTEREVQYSLVAMILALIIGGVVIAVFADLMAGVFLAGGVTLMFLMAFIGMTP